MKYDKTLVVIGASTGGPKALQRILSDLPSDFIAPILIVQHMPAAFTRVLADHLDSIVDLHVKEAVNGETIYPTTVYIAPGDYHMKVVAVNGTCSIALTKEKPRLGHRPAVNVLIESLAFLKGVRKVAVILTGMGTDGAEGVKLLKAKDEMATVIAESESSSIVYGMPKAAVKTNLVNQVVHLHKVGKTIVNIVNQGG